MAMSREEMTKTVKSLVQDCESYRNTLSNDRKTATEYYNGEMTDLEIADGHSAVVSMDVRAAIKKVLPSICRIILGNEKVAEFQPVGPGDEAGADQSTDYINLVVFKESKGHKAVKDAINDALKLRNGIIRWWFEKKRTVTVTSHTGLSEDAVVQLVSDDDVTVLEQSQEVEVFQTPQGPVPQTIYDVKIRRATEKGRIRVAAVQPEKFLIHPDAIDIEESPVTGINERVRRSDLVALGYDRDLIDKVPLAGGADERTDEETTRRRYTAGEDDAASRAMEEVEYYELYVRVDADDDGIAELRRLVYAGAIDDRYLLADEEWDEVPFADIVSEDRPHEREGNSIADDVMELQKIKTVLLRQTMDNIYWQNMPQPIVQEGVISNPDAVLAPTFGKPIRVRQGTPVDAAFGFTKVPFVAQQSFSMLAYLDGELTDRTGISDASSGLAPDALQNMTAKASALIEQAGIGQTELMVKTIADGLERVFRGLLRLTIKHQDKPRVVRLRDEWVEVDPRFWNAEMDVTINTGLGAGTRERDMVMMQMITALQKELLASFGPADNPYVTPDNLYNALVKQVQAAGLNDPSMFFTKPNADELKAKIAQQQQKPDPAAEKAKADIQIKQEKAKADVETDRMKIQADTQLEMEKIKANTELKKYQIESEVNLRARQNSAEMLLGVPTASPVHIGGLPG